MSLHFQERAEIFRTNKEIHLTVVLTQIDSRQGQRVPDDPQVRYQQSSCKIKRTWSVMKSLIGHTLVVQRALKTSIPVVSFRVLYGVQAVDERFSWTSFHLPVNSDTLIDRSMCYTVIKLISTTWLLFINTADTQLLGKQLLAAGHVA